MTVRCPPRAEDRCGASMLLGDEPMQTGEDRPASGERTSYRTAPSSAAVKRIPVLSEEPRQIPIRHHLLAFGYYDAHCVIILVPFQIKINDFSLLKFAKMAWFSL